MNISQQNSTLFRLVAIGWLTIISPVTGQTTNNVRINDRFPVNATNLSPPNVGYPIHECAQAVFVFGFIPGASIQVFSGGNQLVGQQNNTFFAFTVVHLNRELNLGEQITATQTVEGKTSAQSYVPVIVEAYDPSGLQAPIVSKDIFDCGQIVPVGDLVPSVWVSVFANGNPNPIGRDETTGTGDAVITAALRQGELITAQQVACPDRPSAKLTSPMSAPQIVQASPNPPPPPSVDPTIVGNNTVTLHGLFVGAEIEIRNHGSVILSGWLANAADNWFPVNPPIPPNPSIQASQKLCTSSPLSPPQTQTTSLHAPIILPPVCPGSQEVTIRGTQINASVVLLRNGVIVGYGGAVAGDLVLQVGGGQHLNLGDTLTAVQYMGNAIGPFSNPVVVGNCGDMVTYHNDNARTGLNAKETILTLADVNPNSFGKLFSHDVDGYVYAQPLYLSQISIPKQGIHNVVFVATEHDSVYAYDADSNTGINSTWLWHVSFIDPPAGVTTVPANPDHQGPDDLGTGCDDIISEVGITGTPVIDRRTKTLYVVAKTKEVSGGHNHYVQRLHALDVATGAEKFGGPKGIAETICDNPSSASGPYQYVSGPMIPGAGESNDGHGHVFFNALRQAQRPGLALVNGVVYVAWASHCDVTPYHGWVMGFDAQTLKLVSVFNDTPNANSGPSGLAGGGIWQAGAAPAADPQGAVYFATGNGVFDNVFLANGFPKQGDFGDSVLKVVVDPSSSTNSPNENGWGVKAADFFTPHDQSTLEQQDTDLGSGGVLVLPDQDAQPPRLAVQAGKAGTIYLLNRDNMGKFHSGNDNQIVQSLPGAIGGAWNMPAFFNNTVYYNGVNDVLKAFRLINGKLSKNPVAKATPKFGYPGATPSISASTSTNAIVWALQTDQVGNGPTVLHAYRADNLKELYNSAMAGNRDRPPGTAVKFTLPTAVNGKVYVGTSTSIAVYGNLFRVQFRTVPLPPSSAGIPKPQ